MTVAPGFWLTIAFMRPASSLRTTPSATEQSSADADADECYATWLSEKPLQKLARQLAGGITLPRAHDPQSRLGDSLRIEPFSATRSHRHWSSDYLLGLFDSHPRLRSCVRDRPRRRSTPEAVARTWRLLLGHGWSHPSTGRRAAAARPKRDAPPTSASTAASSRRGAAGKARGLPSFLNTSGVYPVCCIVRRRQWAGPKSANCWSSSSGPLGGSS